MQWIIIHSSKLIALFVLIMSSLTIYIGLYTRSQRKIGAEPEFSNIFRSVIFLVLAIAFILIGMVITRNFA